MSSAERSGKKRKKRCRPGFELSMLAGTHQRHRTLFPAEEENMKIDRRKFLRTTGGVISVGAATLALRGRVLGANDRVRVAVCGTRGRGKDHIRGFAKAPGVEIAALCDVDERVLGQQIGRASCRERV